MAGFEFSILIKLQVSEKRLKVCCRSEKLLSGWDAVQAVKAAIGCQLAIVWHGTSDDVLDYDALITPGTDGNYVERATYELFQAPDIFAGVGGKLPVFACVTGIDFPAR